MIAKLFGYVQLAAMLIWKFAGRRTTIFLAFLRHTNTCRYFEIER